ncbi:MAG: hypothetical protein DMD30_01890, partial [Gemmatimonadetes bacterium]
KYAESDGSIGRMSGLTDPTSPSGRVTTTGGILFAVASVGARKLTQAVAPITRQNSVAATRALRATLLQCSQNRSSSAR